MVRRHVNAHRRLQRQAGAADIGRVALSRLNQSHLGAGFLQEIDHVLIFANQAFKFGMREAAVKLHKQIFQHVRVQGVREHKGQPRLRLAGQRYRQLIQPLAGGEDRFDIAQHLLSLRRQRRLPRCPIEEGHPEVSLQVADSGTDRRLAFAQATGGGGERPAVNGLDKGG